MNEQTYDAVVIGSGFGGSVSALRLTSADKKVLLLERGKSYSGNKPFPEDEKGNWKPNAGIYGQHNFVELAPNLTAWNSASLGGGSNIYAGVLLRRKDFSDFPVPTPIDEMNKYYDRVEKMIGGSPFPFENKELEYSKTKKTAWIVSGAKKLGGKAFFPRLGIYWKKPGDTQSIVRINKHGAETAGCKNCGECSVPGCSYNAKAVLTKNYLGLAKNSNNLTIKTMTEVEDFKRVDGVWEITTYSHKEKAYNKFKAKLLILAAGTLGTTELMLKNQGNLPGVSKMIGQKFTTNGTHAGAAIFIFPGVFPDKGPEITVGVEFEGGSAKRDGFYVFDGGYKKPWATLGAMIGMPSFAAKATSVLFGAAERVGAFLPQSTLPLLTCGRDQAVGTLFLDDNRKLKADIDLTKNRNYYDRVEEGMEALCKVQGAKFLPNVLYKSSGKQEVPHPLGGCPIGNSVEDGVVDAYGRVFGVENLMICDGSVMPVSLGVNPSLTIAAQAEKSVEKMLAQLEETGKVSA